MRRFVVIACLACVALAGAYASQTPMGEDLPRVIATEPVRLQTNTKLFSYPVEAQRGQTWAVVKQTRRRVILTFGEDDDRDRFLAMGLKKLPTYRVPPDVFERTFVAEDKWPEVRSAIADRLCTQLSGLAPDKCERLVDGEVWLGLSMEAVEAAVGNRVLERSRTETETGVSEVWRVGAWSASTIAESSAKQVIDAGTWLGDDMSSQAITERNESMQESAIRMVLTFQDGRLTEITTR